MWPDNETEKDFLNFSGVAGTVAEIITQASGRPTSIGISGSWGASILAEYLAGGRHYLAAQPLLAIQVTVPSVMRINVGMLPAGPVACASSRQPFRVAHTVDDPERDESRDSEHASDDNGVVRGVPDAVDESLGLVHGVSFDGLLCFPFTRGRGRTTNQRRRLERARGDGQEPDKTTRVTDAESERSVLARELPWDAANGGPL